MVVNNMDNVFVYGYDASISATLYNIKGNVYCGGWSGCDQMTITNVTGDVIVSAYYGFYLGAMENVVNVC